MTISEEFAAYQEKIMRHPEAYSLVVYVRQTNEVHRCYFDGPVRFKGVWDNTDPPTFKRFEMHLTAH